jgi:hypothetical protein
MRFNVKFTVSNGKETENKFEVIESDTKYDKVNARSILSKKYPDYEITVLKISQSVTAKAEIL